MISENSLNLLPTNALGALSNGLTAKGVDKASELSAEKARNQRLEGVVEVDNTTGGRTVSFLKDTIASIKSAAEIAKSAKSAYDMIKTLSDGGEDAYTPGTLAPGTDDNPAAIDALGVELSDTVGEPAGTSDALALQKKASTMKIAVLQSEFQEIKANIEVVDSVLEKRANGELPDPEINFSAVTAATQNIVDTLSSQGFDSQEVASIQESLTRATNENLENFEKYVSDNIVTPFVENTAALNVIRAQLLGERADGAAEEPIFDTVFGPPVSTDGKFILSKDGLYYDSRTGSIPYITAQKIDSSSWQLQYAANRGGKGQAYTPDNAERYADTILSDEYTKETPLVLNFYKYDDVLVNLQNDRDLQVMDVSAKIADLVASGYATSAAIVQNYKDSYAALGFTYGNKIKKRKKQLQIAALFGPFGVTVSGDAQGEGLFYRLNDPQNQMPDTEECGDDEKVLEVVYSDPNGGSGEVEQIREYIPRIPLNDFSYLKDIGLVPELVSQEQNMLHSEDLDDTTAPLAPVYLTQGPGSPVQAIPEMAIAPEGLSDWLNTSGDTASAGTNEYIRTLDSSIVQDNLIVCYNFLEPSAVVSPSSNTYGVRNYVNAGYGLNAKLVGSNASSVFTSGVSIPYLNGTVFNIKDKYGVRYSYLDASTGNYVRLPNNYMNNRLNPQTQELDDLMYNSNGWSMDFWAHLPGLSSTLTDQHRYRIIAANENCGVPTTDMKRTARITTAELDNGQGVLKRTKGMIIGWRDRGSPGSAQASGLEFVVLPTVAQNSDRWGKSVCIAETVSGDGNSASCRTELGFKVPFSATTTSGYGISSCSGSFAHYVISCNYSQNTISLYANGQFLASSLVSECFGTVPGAPLQIPTQITEGNYQDRSGQFGEKLYGGPLESKPPIFTPWVIGGGFTDGIGHELPTPIFSSTFPGFLGTNTNDSYFRTALGPSGGPVGQHTDLANNHPGLGGYSPTGSNYLWARSGLEGHVGSFKMYTKPLSTSEVEINYKAQNPFFSGISTPNRIL